MNKKILLIICFLGNVVFAQAQTAQDVVNKAISDYKKASSNNPQKSSKTQNDDGYMEKFDNLNQATQPSLNTNQTKNKVSNMQSKTIKNVIPSGAKIVKLKASLSINIPKDKFSILDFPFNITSFDFDGLKSLEPNKNQTLGLEFPEENKAQDSSLLNLEQKGNRIIINSKILGSGQMIVWGGYYPVIIDLSVVKKGGVDYYSFSNPSDPKNVTELKRLENKEHQKVLNILSVALYRDSIPKGYEKLDKKEVFNYKKENFQLVKQYTLKGKWYVAEKWFILNKDKQKPLNLYEEMFYMPDVYSVSLLSDRLEPMKSTAFYIIRQNNQPQ